MGEDEADITEITYDTFIKTASLNDVAFYVLVPLGPKSASSLVA